MLTELGRYAFCTKEGEGEGTAYIVAEPHDIPFEVTFIPHDGNMKKVMEIQQFLNENIKYLKIESTPA